jgi:chromosome segregation ATPase
MTQNVILISLFGGLGTVLLVSVVTLVVAIGVRREARRISKVSDERHSWLEGELERARQDLSKAQQQVQRLEEESPEKLKWELQHVTEELERLQNRHSETQHEVGQQKQEWLHQAAQQEQQRLRLEQERQHLMEELERWRGRYVEAQIQVEGLKQERSDAQQKVEQLTQLRERLLTEIQEIGKE